MQLRVPTIAFLPSYQAALKRGWSPDNTRPEAAEEELDRSAADPDAFLALMIDKEAVGGPVTLADGSQAPRLPSIRLWMWDGEFSGSASLRWQSGTEQLPPYCLGHIGYSVVPWKRRLGYATAALRQLLPYARTEGLTYVDLATTTHNEPSQKVILANGGSLIDRSATFPQHGSTPVLRWRIVL